jgi:hypothetical protein
MGKPHTLATSRRFFGLGAAHRRLFIAAALLAVAAVACLPLLGASSASAAPLAVLQCNGTDNSTNEAVACTVVVTNTVNVATGVKSSSTVVTECHGFANAEPVCELPQTLNTNDVVLSVDQCNGSGNGTGSTVICSVEVINNIVGTATPQTVTINQCQESGAGGADATSLNCDSYDSTDPSTATVVQCNGSGNGGGGILRVTCTVEGGSTASVIPTTVNQCNGSGNGGGAYVTCSVAFTTNIVAGPDDGEGEGEGGGDDGETGGETGGGTGGETGGETGGGIGGGTDGGTTPPGADTPGTPGGPGTPGNPEGSGGSGSDGSGSATGSSAGALANTGMPVENILLGGASVLLLGLVVAVLARRRHTVKN